MGSQEVLEAAMSFHSTDGVNDLESKKTGIGMDQDENLNVGFLEDWDKMMEDVENRLRVARMVSDSVIKGTVSAVEQDADEKIKAKELEIVSLKRSLNVNGDQNKSTVDHKAYASFEEVCVKHNELKESATDEFKRIRKQIEGVKGSKMKRNGSCHELLGLSGILKDECDLDKTVDNLEMMMTNMSKLVDNVAIQGSISQNLQLVEISDLRNDLESLAKLLPSGDSGNLISHGSLDIDMTHGNPLRSQLSIRWEENGESTESKPDVADNFDVNSLNHLKREELIKFFNNLILKLKREHEAEIHQMADNYINLKGKYLSEKRSFVPNNKDFEALKKKIPEVVVKLDDIFIGKGDNDVRQNTVLRENRQLRGSLAVMNDEVKNLSSQLTSVSENHKSLMADTFLEASVVEDVYKCVIRDIQNMKEESELKVVALQDIYEVLLENTCICAIEDMRMEALFTQQLLETVFKETFIDVNQKLKSLHKKYITTSENLRSLETKAMKMGLEAEEREKLKKQVLKTESEKLSKAEEKLLSVKMEIDALNQRLAVATEEIKTSNDRVSLVEAKESDHRKQMEALVVCLDELSSEFFNLERRVTRDVKNNCARLENSTTQLRYLIPAVNVVKTTGIMHRDKLERTCYDLKMAEEEVDLLGDEVETLLGLLEKIYIALDHYSPVLQHYPGVIEILELVRRELSCESLKQ